MNLSLDGVRGSCDQFTRGENSVLSFKLKRRNTGVIKKKNIIVDSKRKQRKANVITANAN